MEINILIDENLEIRLEAKQLESLVEKVLVTQKVDSNTELGLLITDQEKIHQLNLDYLGEDEPTDVLSFAMLSEQAAVNSAPFVLPPDGIQHIGEVIISYPQAAIQAEEHSHSVEREIAILIIHGVLHLLGYDHGDPAQEREMKGREAAILSFI